MSPLPARTDWLGHARLPSLLGYMAVLFLATLVPFAFDPDSARVAERLGQMLHPTVHQSDVVDAARNVVLFAGWGAVWALTARGSVPRIITEATLSGAALSLLVECTQLFSSNRVASLLDVSTNTGGALLGSAGLIFLIALAGQQRAARSFVGIPALLFGAGYGFGAFLEAAIPLFRRDLLAFGGPLSRLRASMDAFSMHSLMEIPWTDIPLFIPAGALAVAALAEAGVEYRVAFARVALGGAVLSLLAELSHGPLGQAMSAGAATVHALSVALGAWLAMRGLPRLTVQLRGSARPRALAIGYSAVLAMWSWRPFLPEVDGRQILAKITREWYIPLAALSMSGDFFSVVDVCAPFFRFLPLGGLLAVWPWRKHGWLSGPLPAIWVATVLEAGQIVVLGRLMDITDVLIPAAGALVGWAVVRRAGYRVYGEMGR